jgi:hypothetical protein
VASARVARTTVKGETHVDLLVLHDEEDVVFGRPTVLLLIEYEIRITIV